MGGRCRSDSIQRRKHRVQVRRQDRHGRDNVGDRLQPPHNPTRPSCRRNPCHRMRPGILRDMRHEARRHAHTGVFTAHRRQFRRGRLRRSEAHGGLGSRNRAAGLADTAHKRHHDHTHMGRLLPLFLHKHLRPSPAVRRPEAAPANRRRGGTPPHGRPAQGTERTATD